MRHWIPDGDSFFAASAFLDSTPAMLVLMGSRSFRIGKTVQGLWSQALACLVSDATAAAPGGAS